MKIEANQSNEVLIVHAIENLNADNAPEFAKQLKRHCNPDIQKLILDFSPMTNLDSAGLRILYLLSKKAKTIDGNLIVVGLQPSVRDVFDDTGFIALCKIAGNVEEGLAVN